VRADVGHGTKRTPFVGLEPPVPIGREEQPVLEVAAVDVPDVADVSIRDQGAGLLALRVKPDVEVRAMDEAASLRELDEVRRLLRVDRKRLLTDDVLAGLEGRARLCVVEVVRRRQMDGVDAIVREHLFKALVRLR
jgi:hypothetical protein